MKKMSVNDLIEFRGKSTRAKKTFVENLKSNRIETPVEGGGDYWVTSLSAVCRSYSADDLDLIDKKIDELKGKLSGANDTRIKHMYQRNISILQNYKSMDLKNLRPGEKISSLKKSTGKSLLTIKGLDIQTRPSHIYTFGKANETKVGAIWFTAKVKGYRVEEVGMFCEMLYKFLDQNYSQKYQLTPQYCTAVDMLSGHVVDYSKIEAGKVSQVLTPTLDEINKLM